MEDWKIDDKARLKPAFTLGTFVPAYYVSQLWSIFGKRDFRVISVKNIENGNMEISLSDDPLARFGQFWPAQLFEKVTDEAQIENKHASN